MRILLLLILPIFLSFDNPPPKSNVFPGYVILESGKRLEGIVQLGTFIERELKIKFVDRGKKVTYTPEEIKGYGFEQTQIDDLGLEKKSWIHFERMEALEPPRIFAPKNVFVEREVEGTFDLFCFFIQQRSNIDKPYEYYYLLRSEKGELTKVTEASFSKKIKQHFGAYTALIDRLGKKQFRFDNMTRIVKDYNYWLENQHDPTVYKVSPENYDSASNQ